jgi:signal transduction histidine kinase
MKMKGKSIINILGVLTLYIGLILIHEFSHLLSAVILQQEITKVGIGLANESLLSLAFYVRVNFTNTFSKGIISLAGTLGALIVSFLIMLLSIRLKRLLLFVISLGYVLSELFYWCVSPLIGLGDAYIFINSLNITFSFYFICLFIIFILFLSMMFTLYKKTFSWKAKEKEIQERKRIKKQQERQFQLERAKARLEKQ